MTAARRVGILGGMFDPIHCGHLDVAAAAERALTLSTVLVIPAALPPHRPQPIASACHRFAMVALAIAGRRGWRALDIELQQPGTSYTSTTLRRFHADGFLPSELFFITGADAFLEIETWRNYPAVFDLAHFVVVARPGAALTEVPVRLPDLAGRMVRIDSVRLKADPTYEPAGVKAAPTCEPLHLTADTASTQADPTHQRSDSAKTCIFLIDAPTADVSSSAIRSTLRVHQSIAGMVPLSVQQHIEQHGLYDDSTSDAERLERLSAAAAGRLHGEN